MFANYSLQLVYGGSQGGSGETEGEGGGADIPLRVGI